MDKASLAAALEKIQSHSQEQPCTLAPEESKSLHVFVDSREKAPDLSEKEKNLLKKILAVLRAEDEVASSNGDKKELERRSRNTLRDAIDKAKAGNWQELSRAEIGLMRDTRKTLESRGDKATDKDKRLIGIFNTVLAKYDEFVAAHPESAIEDEDSPSDTDEPGENENSSARSSTADVVNTLDAKTAFSDKIKSHMSVLEDVRVDINVRAFEFEGETLLNGDVPTDVLLQIRDGGITVEGLVSGNVVASGDVTIKGNVQGGTVISKGGSISLKRGMLNSMLIAKKGSVTCQHLETPSCVFAWDTLSVEEAVLGGSISARTIHVAGKIASGKIHSCGEVSVGSFEIAQNAAPVVCLLDSLNCEDYLRTFDTTTSERRLRLEQLDINIETATHMDKFTNQLIKNSYRTALFYLLGGVKSAMLASGLQGLNTLSVFLRQILSVAESVVKYYRSAPAPAEDEHRKEGDKFRDENIEALKIVRKEVEGLPDEFGSTNRRYLLDRCIRLNAMILKLHREYLELRAESYLRGVFNTSLTEWRGSLGTCDREIRTTIQKFGLESQVLERIESEHDSLSQMLEEVIQEKLQSDYSEDVQRARSPLVRILQEAAARNARSIEKSGKLAREAREERDKIREELREDSAVLFGDSKPGACFVRAKNFARGTVLTTKRGDVEGFDSNLGKVIVIVDDVTNETTFILEGQLIRRQA